MSSIVNELNEFLRFVKLHNAIYTDNQIPQLRALRIYLETKSKGLITLLFLCRFVSNYAKLII